jgi:hypothetical protein
MSARQDEVLTTSDCAAARALERLVFTFLSFAESAVREPETRISSRQASQYEALIIAAQEGQRVLEQHNSLCVKARVGGLVTPPPIDEDDIVDYEYCPEPDVR